MTSTGWCRRPLCCRWWLHPRRRQGCCHHSSRALVERGRALVHRVSTTDCRTILTIPRKSTLPSPWPRLVSGTRTNTASDYDLVINCLLLWGEGLFWFLNKFFSMPVVRMWMFFFVFNSVRCTYFIINYSYIPFLNFAPCPWNFGPERTDIRRNRWSPLRLLRARNSLDCPWTIRKQTLRITLYR